MHFICQIPLGKFFKKEMQKTPLAFRKEFERL
jgi:hypothetical protein